MPGVRRGRAPEPQDDPTAAFGRSFTPLVRLGWLLRAWRVASGQPYGAEFAAALRDAGVPADASRVSRWESGSRAPALAVVAEYERLTGAPPGSIQAAMLGAARLPGARVWRALEGVAFDADDVAALLDRAVDGTASGGQWLWLACQVAAHPDRVTMPRSTWQAMTTRLVEQVGRSVGNAWGTRYEAAMLLARHPHGQSALVGSVEALVDEPGTPMAVDHLSLLQDTRGTEVNQLVLRLLDAPPGAVFSGALWVTGAKVSRGHLSEAELEQVETVLLRRLRERDPSEGGTGNPFVEFADVVAALPANARTRIVARAPQLARLVAIAELAGQRGRPAHAHLGVVKEVTRGLGEDPLVVRLVMEALFHPDNERRNQSCITFLASPLRTPLSDNVCRVLDQRLDPAPGHRRPAWLVRLAVLMSFVNDGQPRHDEVLARVALAKIPASPFAVFALAHSRGTDVLLDPMALLSPPRRQVPSAPGLYYAGMRGLPALAMVADDAAFADAVREAARWWQRTGPAIHED